MALRYDFRSNPNMQADDEQQVLHPRIVVSGTKELDDIVNEISKFSSFTPGVVLGVLEELSHYLAQSLAEGYNVKLGQVGTFSGSLGSRPVTDKSEIRSSSISFDGVNFRPTPDFIKSIRGATHIERVPTDYGFQASSKRYTKEERWQLLSDYLKEHTFITRSDYSDLTGLLRTKATLELKEWAEQKLIKKDGRRTHIVYMAV